MSVPNAPIRDPIADGSTGNVSRAWTTWFDALISAVSPPGGGPVTSVGLSLPTQFAISNSPINSSGTLTGAWKTQTAGTVLAGPATGAAAAPTFRALVATDIPSLSGYQPSSTILSALAGLTYAAPAFVRMNGASSFQLDTNTYLTTSTASSTYVPYTGATTDLALGVHNLTLAGNIASSGTRAGTVYCTSLDVTNQIVGSVSGAAGSAGAVSIGTQTLNQGNLAYVVVGGATSPVYTRSDLTLSTAGILSAAGFSGPLTGNVTGNASGSSGSCTGNSATATKATNLVGGLLGSLPYQTAVDTTGFLGIGTAGKVLWVNVGGTAPEWVAQSSLNVGTAGSCATATAADHLTTARAINGVNFDGSAPITVPVNNSNDAANADYFALFTATQGGNYAALTSTGLKYHPSTGVLTATGFSGPLTGNVTGNVSGSSGSCTGNAATVTGLSVTAGQTLTVTTGGTLGSAAYTASSAYLPIGGGTLTGDVALGVHNLTLSGNISTSGTRAGTIYCTTLDVSNQIVGSVSGSSGSTGQIAVTHQGIYGGYVAVAGSDTGNSSVNTIYPNAAGWLKNDGAGFFSFTTPTAAQVGALALHGTADAVSGLTITAGASVSGSNTGDQTLSGLGGVPTGRTLTGTAPITIAGDNSAHDLSADRTIAIVAASASVAGSMSAAHYSAVAALGTASTHATGDFATSTQGSHADTAYGWGNFASASTYIGTTNVSLARASATLSLAGVNIDGSAGTVPGSGITGSHGIPDAALGTNVPLLNAANAFSDATQSTSYTTGAIKIAGGLGIAKDLYTNGAATFAGGMTLTAGDLLGHSGFVLKKDGSDTFGLGPYVVIANAAATNQWAWQLNASSGLNLFYYNGLTTIPLSVSAAGALSVAAGVSATTGSFSGDFAVATTKFTVAAATGNTTIGGTLDIAGTVTPHATATYDLGSTSYKWKDLHIAGNHTSDGWIYQTAKAFAQQYGSALINNTGDITKCQVQGWAHWDPAAVPTGYAHEGLFIAKSSVSPGTNTNILNYGSGGDTNFYVAMLNYVDTSTTASIYGYIPVMHVLGGHDGGASGTEVDMQNYGGAPSTYPFTSQGGYSKTGHTAICGSGDYDSTAAFASMVNYPANAKSWLYGYWSGGARTAGFHVSHWTPYAGTGAGGTGATTSTTATTPATGSQSFAVGAGVALYPGQRIYVRSRAHTDHFMAGTVTTYSGTSLVMNVTEATGGSSYADWDIGGNWHPSVAYSNESDSPTFIKSTGTHASYILDTNNFKVTGAGGVSATTGSFSGDFAVATTKFTVAAATGNTTIGGTLAVTGTTQSPKFQVPYANYGTANYGGIFEVGENTGGTAKAAGTIVLRSRGGTTYFLWVDNDGYLRYHTAGPTSDSTSSDVAGRKVSYT